MSASWASLLKYHTCQRYMVLVTHTVMFIASVVSYLYVVFVFSGCAQQKIVFLCIMLAHVFKVGTTSGI